MIRYETTPELLTSHVEQNRLLRQRVAHLESTVLRLRLDRADLQRDNARLLEDAVWTSGQVSAIKNLVRQALWPRMGWREKLAFYRITRRKP